MKAENILVLLGLAIICASCQKEVVSIDEVIIQNDKEISEGNNFLKFNEGTFLATEETSILLEKIDSNQLVFSSSNAQLDSLEPGSVLFSNSNTNEGEGYFRKVRQIIREGDKSILITSEATLGDAFKSYHLHSKANKTSYARSTDFFDYPIEFKTGSYKVSVQADFEPNFDLDFRFDTIHSFVILSGETENLTNFNMTINLQSLSFTGSMGYSISGKFSGKKEFKILPEPVPIYKFGAVPLQVFFDLKAYIKGGYKGNIELPGVEFSLSPTNFTFAAAFDGTTLSVTHPTLSLGALTASTTPFSSIGEVGIEIGIEPKIFVSTSSDGSIKAGGSTTAYVNSSITFGGDFSDLIPEINTSYTLGVGNKLFLEMFFFGNETQNSILGNIPLFDAVSGKVEYPFDNIPLYSYNVPLELDCNPFSEIDFNPSCEGGSAFIDLSVHCSNCFSSGYNIYIDGIKNNSSPFQFGSPYRIELPDSSVASYSVWIQNESDPHCILKETLYNPCELIYDCVDEAVDDTNEAYCVTQIGDQFWMAQSLRNNNAGRCYANQPGLECDRNGRLYLMSELVGNEVLNEIGEERKIRGLCPPNYHIPTLEEWNTLIENSGGLVYGGRNLKTDFAGAWSTAEGLPESSLFHAFPSGEYYQWLESLSHSDSANFGGADRKAVFWSSTKAPQGGVYIVEINYQDVLQATVQDEIYTSSDGTNTISVANEIGYSCRCVKD